jgi:RNA polymerase sigma-70 factor (ECF subfamily)
VGRPARHAVPVPRRQPITAPSRPAGDPDRARFERLFADHHAAVTGYARRRASSALADDVVAETFVVAWRRIAEVPDDARPWLLAVARRVLMTQRRAESRRLALVERLAHNASQPPHDAARADGQLGAALATLSPLDREALMLVAWEGLSAADAARVMETSHAAMRVRLHRARKRLARALRHTAGRDEAGDA